MPWVILPNSARRENAEKIHFSTITITTKLTEMKIAMKLLSAV